MMTVIALIVIAGSAYGYGWSRGSKDGFNKAIEQLERIIEITGRRR